MMDQQEALDPIERRYDDEVGSAGPASGAMVRPADDG